MSSQILLGLATAKSVALTTLRNVFGFTTPAALDETSSSTTCACGPKCGKLRSDYHCQCVASKPEASGSSCTPTTPHTSSKTPDEDTAMNRLFTQIEQEEAREYLRRRYGITQPIGDE